jgi:hypothetical protein
VFFGNKVGQKRPGGATIDFLPPSKVIWVGTVEGVEGSDDYFEGQRVLEIPFGSVKVCVPSTDGTEPVADSDDLLEYSYKIKGQAENSTEYEGTYLYPPTTPSGGSYMLGFFDSLRNAGCPDEDFEDGMEVFETDDGKMGFYPRADAFNGMDVTIVQGEICDDEGNAYTVGEDKRTYSGHLVDVYHGKGEGVPSGAYSPSFIDELAKLVDGQPNLGAAIATIHKANPAQKQEMMAALQAGDLPDGPWSNWA